LIGQLDEQGHMNVLGVGTCRSEGISRGEVVDIDRTVQAIQSALVQAEQLAETRVNEVLVGIAGEHIQSYNLEGSIDIPHMQRGIDERDRDRAIKKVCESVVVPTESEAIHHVVQSFMVNGNRDVMNPLGLSSEKLGVRVHFVLASNAAVQNITRCVRRAGLRVRSLALESLASSLSVLSAPEKDMGVLLLDIGGGTTDFAVFKNGCISASGEIGHGGNSITQDIQYMWKLSFHDAENLKKKLGTAVPMTLDPEEKLELPSLHANQKPEKKRRRELATIIEARVEEILTAAREKAGRVLEDLHAGVVLTGGSAMLADIDQVAERVFGMKCRVGHPQGIRGMSGMLDNSPIYSTGVGLLYFGFDSEHNPSPAVRRNWLNVLFPRLYESILRWIPVP